MNNYSWEIQGKYEGRWEAVTTEESFVEAKQMLKCYNENEPQHPHRIKRIKEEEEDKMKKLPTFKVDSEGAKVIRETFIDMSRDGGMTEDKFNQKVFDVVAKKRNLSNWGERQTTEIVIEASRLQALEIIDNQLKQFGKMNHTKDELQCIVMFAAALKMELGGDGE